MSAVIAIPAVDLHASAARAKGDAIHFNRGRAPELVAGKVGIVRRVYPVLTQGPCHVHVDLVEMARVYCTVIARGQNRLEMKERYKSRAPVGLRRLRTGQHVPAMSRRW